MKNVDKVITLAALLAAVPAVSSAAWGIKDRIYSAASAGNVYDLENILRQGYSVDETDYRGMTALCSASADYNAYAYNLLLNYGANPNAPCMRYVYEGKNYAGISPAYMAAGVSVLAAGGIVLALSGGGGGGGGSGSSDDDDNNSGSGTGTGGNTGGGSNSGTGTGGNTGGGSNSGTGTGGNTGGGSGSGTGTGGNTGGGSNSGTGTGGNTGGGSGSGTGTGGNTGGGSNSGTGTGGNTGGGSNSGTGTGGNTGGGSGSGTGTGGNTGGGSGSGTGTGGNTGGSDTGISFYGKDYFLRNSEFKGFSTASKGANFLGDINAAPAYGRYYGIDANGKETNTLKGTSVVGMIDTGVYGGHDEFKKSDGSSKVSGYNFDYGPCNGSDSKNCWGVSGQNSDGSYELTLYGYDGKKVKETKKTSDEYVNWYRSYPAGYDWDKYKTREDSFYPANDTREYAHGTNVAGIIAANRDGKGMMGVAFDNTDIKAVRWDLMSSIYEPVKVLVDDGVAAINLSIGTGANTLKNSYWINIEGTSLMVDGWAEAAEYTINRYKSYTSGGKAHKDGTIWVKAAGNSSYEYPDLESGIKLLSKYSELMMLVVVNVDVTLNNSDGTVKSYKKVASSNACGNTSAYCISAPGSVIYSTGTNDDYIPLGGTSQATPMVSGAIAFLKNAFPSLSSDQIIDLLLRTANKDAADNYKANVYGAGLLDLGKALEYQSPVPGTSSVMTVSGDDLGSSYVRLDDASLAVPAAFADSLQRALPQSITAFDAYGRAYDYPTAGYVRSTHSDYKNFKSDVEHIIPAHKLHTESRGNISFTYAEGGTYASPLGFVSAEYKSGAGRSGFWFSENSKYKNAEDRSADLSNPFMAFNSAYGYRYGYDINRRLSFKTELAGGRNGLYDGSDDYNDGSFKKAAYGFESGFDYKYGRNTKFGISAGMLYEDDALLGMNGDNAFAPDGGNTYYVGLNFARGFMKKWTLSGSWYQGYTAARKFGSGMLSTSDLVSTGFAADLNYKPDETKSFGLRVSSPLRVEKGDISVDFANGRDNETDTVYRSRYKAPLKPERREYKFALYADKSVSEDLSFGGELGLRINPGHTDADNDYRAMFGLNYNF